HRRGDAPHAGAEVPGGSCRDAGADGQGAGWEAAQEERGKGEGEERAGEREGQEESPGETRIAGCGVTLAARNPAFEGREARGWKQRGNALAPIAYDRA